MTLILGGAVVLALALAGPAWGRPELDWDRASPGSETDLALRVPVERENAGNHKVVLEVPEGFTGAVCRADIGWRCTVASGEGSAGFRLTWERLDQASVPAGESGGDAHGPDLFHFTVRTPAEEGSYPLPVEQVYTTGEHVRWDGPPGSANPAPSLAVRESRDRSPVDYY